MPTAVHATAHPDDQAAAAADFCRQRVRTYAGNLPFAMLASLLVAALFVMLESPTVPWPALWPWLGAILASQLLRGITGLCHHASPPGRWSDTTWLRIYRLGVLLHGAAWGLASLLPIPPDNTLAEALRVIVVLGLVGGSFSLLAFDLTAALYFAVPALGGVCLHLLGLQQPVYTTLAWAGLGTLLFLSVAGHRASQVVRQHVALLAVTRRQADELRCSQARLAEQSAALQLTLDSISQGIATLNPEGRLKVFNRRAQELLDLPPEMVGREAGYEELRNFQRARGDLPPDGYIDAQGQTQPLPRARGDSPAVYVRRTRTGALIEVRTRLLPDGGLVRTYTDVSDYLQAQQDLGAARDEAERANRAKSQFLSGMSHELRTPLNAVLGFGEVLLADTQRPLDAAHRQPVQEIMNGAQHLLQLINDLLDLALVESGRLRVHPTPQPLVPLLQNALALMQALADAGGIRLPAGSGPAEPERAALPEDALVLADRTRLMQVLLNLLSNAIKYNRPGGAVRLTCRALPASASGQAARWRIEVSDDGPGLDAAQCARLFDPFERLGAARSAVQGAGLGLALSRGLVQAMGGEIGVHSQPGQGSCFWVALPDARTGRPAAASATPAPARTDPATPLAPMAAATPLLAALAPVLHPGQTLLYIEDNPVNVMLMEAMLALLGRPRLAVAGLAADGLRQALALQPALILLDIELPDMDGYELMRQLRQHEAARHIPVLAVSANATPADIHRGLAAGFAHYLTKPLALAQLHGALASSLGRAEPAR